jgi:hypothetical protein
MLEETVMHVQDRPTPNVPALAPTRYGTGPLTAPAATITIAAASMLPGAGLQGEFELEAEQ